MKLRNKKTGEILYGLLGSYPVTGDATIEYMDENAESGYSVYARYKTLAELNEEWEDYKPAEPLIKDEKVRKAVRAWAEANRHTLIQYDKAKDCLYFLCGSDIDDTSLSINFDDLCAFKKLEHKHLYTINELCGDNEE